MPWSQRLNDDEGHIVPNGFDDVRCPITMTDYVQLLNQVCAWFLRIASVRECLYACVCVCPPLRLLITGGVIWTPYDWSNKFYGSYMAPVVDILVWLL